MITKTSWFLGGFKQLASRDREQLSLPISNEEIRSAIFSIGGDKAPGEDGFLLVFFHNC